jgi:hypothetical protein
VARLVALVGVGAWFGVLAVAALAVHWSEPPRPAVPRSTLPPLLEQLNAARPQGNATPWIVTRAVSAHHVLVANVRADNAASARDIATRLVGAVTNRQYDEILIYVWAAGARRQNADRRVQWTPGGGYTELVIGD